MDKPKLLTLQFDDGLKGVFNRANPILDKHLVNPVASVALITDFLEDNRDTTMTWDDANILRNKGWEMCCHQTTNKRVDEMTDEELHEMYRTVNRKFTDQGWDIPEITFLHGRRSDERSRQIIYQYRKIIFNENPTRTTINYLDDLGINYKIITGEMKTESKVQANKSEIDKLSNGDYDWMIYRDHDVRDAPTTYPDCSYTHLFDDMIEHIASKDNIKLVTIEQGLRLLKAWGKY